ncbi:MAG: response regulator [Thermoflexales bacterium]|nr:response regulator [Thermoflexales bacterium]
MPRIMYVEDDPTARLLVERILGAEGYEIILVEDGLAAIETARRERPELVLMDINMPGLDGYATTTKLKSMPDMQGVPIIALTANVVEGDRDRALAAGCDGYLPKPIDADYLAHEVEAFLHGKREQVAEAVLVEKLEEHTRRLVDRLEMTITELREANTELRRLDKMKSDFIVLASHELRTPLTMLYGYTNLLTSDMARLHVPDDTMMMVRKLTEASERLNNVVDDIVNMALIDAEQIDLELTAVNLGEVVLEVLGDFERIIRERKHSIEVGPMRHLPAIQADQKYIRRAITNVVSNAIKYTPDGGFIQIKCFHAGNALDLIVRDNGIGINPAERNRIFEKFYVLEDISFHSSSPTQFRGGGIGLGLSVVRGVIKAHGGKVWVESEGYDEQRCPGSTFHLLLPLEPPRPTLGGE